MLNGNAIFLNRFFKNCYFSKTILAPPGPTWANKMSCTQDQLKYLLTTRNLKLTITKINNKLDCLVLYLFIYLFVYLFIYLFTYLFIYLLVYLSIYLFIHLLTYDDGSL